ncbi:hypothetical protein LX32DRAFT_636845 [Colletotrichum zoysiae]|uniref:Uncharacterized protein n=1 Tax=Colletotrichum zoysiae TaxID=1216348 RepID=A0AAD9M7D3_9PEZI|nr:hypothetical protein LX32DRAFT_636845 [Colletotrichum zoysiae]
MAFLSGRDVLCDPSHKVSDYPGKRLPKHRHWLYGFAATSRSTWQGREGLGGWHLCDLTEESKATRTPTATSGRGNGPYTVAPNSEGWSALGSVDGTDRAIEFASIQGHREKSVGISACKVPRPLHLDTRNRRGVGPNYLKSSFRSGARHLSLSPPGHMTAASMQARHREHISPSRLFLVGRHRGIRK